METDLPKEFGQEKTYQRTVAAPHNVPPYNPDDTQFSYVESGTQKAPPPPLIPPPPPGRQYSLGTQMPQQPKPTGRRNFLTKLTIVAVAGFGLGNLFGNAGKGDLQKQINDGRRDEQALLNQITQDQAQLAQAQKEEAQLINGYVPLNEKIQDLEVENARLRRENELVHKAIRALPKEYQETIQYILSNSDQIGEGLSQMAQSANPQKTGRETLDEVLKNNREALNKAGESITSGLLKDIQSRLHMKASRQR
ncbi:MAG TPA: hypothetical protein VFV38_33030 [Ktedonobacteraceae bacterium]|nr:hypothetical protein [Ktedonobacteraceae bacterium]